MPPVLPLCPRNFSDRRLALRTVSIPFVIQNVFEYVRSCPLFCVLTFRLRTAPFGYALAPEIRREGCERGLPARSCSADACTPVPTVHLYAFRGGFRVPEAIPRA